MQVFTVSGDVTPLSLDEAIDRIIDLQKDQKRGKEVLDNLKAVAKLHMKNMGVDKHETPTGHKAAFSTSQRTKYDKKALLELLGEDYALCVSIEEVKSFKVS